MTLTLPRLHSAQKQIVVESQRFNVVTCGRRFGKSVLLTDRLIQPALDGYPVAWFAPTYKNLLEIWRDFVRILAPVSVKSNAVERRIELVTGGVLEMWSLDSPDSARGRKYKRIAGDELAMVRNLMYAWRNVLRPTLLDYSGDAWFASTPKGQNDYKALHDFGQDDAMHEWASWQMPTWSNPHIKKAEIEALRNELPPRVFQQEIEAKFLEDVEGALWQQSLIDSLRVTTMPQLSRIVIGVDPAASSGETGIVVAGLHRGQQRTEAYVLDDVTTSGQPEKWVTAIQSAYSKHNVDIVVAEINQGGDMVESVIRNRGNIPVKKVRASKGKVARAEPIADLYSQGRVHHVGYFSELESQMTTYVAGDKSPDRLDALVWALTELFSLDTSGKKRTAVTRVTPYKKQGLSTFTKRF